MSTDYDAVAEEYKRSKLAPWRTYLERCSLLNLLGEVRGKSVLDLACGEGFYSRLVRERGAGRVVGVDWSSGMIGLAIAAEKESPLGLKYRVGDAMAYQTDERFDIVAAGRWCMNRNWPATNPTHRSITYQERTTMAYRARPSG